MTDVESVPQAEVDAWAETVARMYYGERFDPSDLHAAENASANLMSGWGLLVPLPSEVVEMIRQAIETGYATALVDVRGGQYDGEIQTWRPYLAIHEES